MIDIVKKLLNILKFGPMECILPDGKKIYIVIGGEPINTMIFEEDQIDEFESKNR